jgi:hypothetical protein
VLAFAAAFIIDVAPTNAIMGPPVTSRQLGGSTSPVDDSRRGGLVGLVGHVGIVAQAGTAEDSASAAYIVARKPLTIQPKSQPAINKASGGKNIRKSEPFKAGQ